MSNEAPVMYRYSRPNRYDQAPFMTKCQVTNGNLIELYVQTSKDEEKPYWLLLRSDKKKIKETA